MTRRDLGPRPLTYPMPVLLVGVYDAEGRPNLMAAAWGGICNSTPPCVSVSIRPSRWTHDPLLQRKAFTLGIPSTALAAQAEAGTPVTIVYELAEPTTETLSPIAPIAPQPGVVNIVTDADALSAAITGSGWDTIGDMGGLEAQLAAKADAADLAAVATSGSYNDLADKPTIPSPVTVDDTITEGGTNPVTGGAIYEALVGKVDVESGKGLSTNDYTTAEKTKLAGVAEGANKTIVDSTLSADSENPVQNKAVQEALAGKADSTHTQSANTITAGTLAGQVKANATAAAALDVSQVRNIRAGTADLTPGESALATGEVYLVYE